MDFVTNEQDVACDRDVADGLLYLCFLPASAPRLRGEHHAEPALLGKRSWRPRPRQATRLLGCDERAVEKVAGQGKACSDKRTGCRYQAASLAIAGQSDLGNDIRSWFEI